MLGNARFPGGENNISMMRDRLGARRLSNDSELWSPSVAPARSAIY